MLVQLRRDLSDIPILRQITETLGSEVWYNTVLILTHAQVARAFGAQQPAAALRRADSDTSCNALSCHTVSFRSRYFLALDLERLPKGS